VEKTNGEVLSWGRVAGINIQIKKIGISQKFRRGFQTNELEN
jgi:hypothetical protein